MKFQRTGMAAVALLAGILLAAAGPYTKSLSPQDLRHIKTVAVISAVGGSFLFEHIGDGHFEWLGPPDSHFLEVSDWALDPMIAREVTAALAKHFAVKPIASEPANFSSCDDSALKRSTLDINADPAIDAYVLILRDWRNDEIGYGVHEVDGLGFYRRDESKTKFGVFASYRVAVVDALTGNIIASRPALLPGGAFPWLQVQPSLWPKTQNDLTGAQRATIIADETRLIEASLLRTLAEMNLAR